MTVVPCPIVEATIPRRARTVTMVTIRRFMPFLRGPRVSPDSILEMFRSPPTPRRIIPTSAEPLPSRADEKCDILTVVLPPSIRATPTTDKELAGAGTARILRASMSPRKKPRNRPPLVLRVVKARPRLFSSCALGILITGALSLSNRWRGSTRVLVGWDTAVAVYLVLAFFMLTVIAAVASLAAIVVELSSSALPGGGRRGSHILLASLTIMLSWFFIHMMFALHYAHEFYAATDGRGLAFPGNDRTPDYWDFLYFSLVIGMTSQVSDVGVIKKEIRRTVAAHGVISFFFNVALLALTVNIAASAI